ncbi:MAG: hypothetical protein JW982_14345 [Spirochaetes bacterium]|nr:hypothetical protein [Spirochaetota bacterium]
MSRKTINLNNTRIYRCTEKINEIICIKGIIWISYPKSTDIILKKGESFKTSGRNNILIQAMPECIAEII